MFDVNQPANSLLCRLKSLNLGGGSYNCNPDSISGYSRIEIPIDELEVGTDTYSVTVTDQSELQGYASTTVIFGSIYPESDDDGDGYGNEEGAVDCDDTNPNVYPFAAEIVDGIDNDCDNMIDERTTASMMTVTRQ